MQKKKNNSNNNKLWNKMKRKMESEIENNRKFEARAGRKAEKDELINKEAWRLKKKKRKEKVFHTEYLIDT